MAKNKRLNKLEHLKKERRLAMKCPDCRIPMRVIKDTEDVIYYTCPNCNRTEKKIKERKIYTQL